MIARRLQWALGATVLVVAVMVLTEEPEGVVAARPVAADRSATSRTPAAPRALAQQSPEPRPWSEPSEAALRAWSGPPAAPATPSAAVAVVQPRAPTPPVLVVDAAPRAPAFGFELIGTVSEAGVLGALIGNAQRALWVRPGDTVDGGWRVVQVSAHGVDLLWMPQQLPARLGYRSP